MVWIDIADNMPTYVLCIISAILYSVNIQKISVHYTEILRCTEAIKNCRNQKKLKEYLDLKEGF